MMAKQNTEKQIGRKSMAGALVVVLAMSFVT